MMFLVVFGLTFIAGPTAFWVLARRRPSQGYALALCVIAIGLVVTSYMLSKIGVPFLKENPYAGAVVIVMVWIAWIMMLALCVLAARLRALPNETQRLTFALCAVGTTLPWFGMVLARIMDG